MALHIKVYIFHVKRARWENGKVMLCNNENKMEEDLFISGVNILTFLG